MTTPERARLYDAQHVAETAGKKWAVYNPQNLPVDSLPIIYGWNNGGSSQWHEAELIAEDGTHLGGHICSNELYMEHDLGILEDSRPDRHEGFKKHYPNGYRMEFVSHGAVKDHAGLNKAFKLI